MKKIINICLLLMLFGFEVTAQQFDLSAEIRPRFESKHGYKSLIGKGVDAGNFVSQRSRLNFKFKQNNIQLGMTMQNVRVWGDVSTLSAKDNASNLHEAWATAILNDKFALKLGRQEIVYDDHRIFGSVGWAQQARSHDALIAKITPAEHQKLDIGFAMNADGQGGVDKLYSGVAGYKNFQYAWYHGDFNKLGLSVLVLNRGGEYQKDSVTQKVDYMQTVGPRFTYKAGKFSANAAAYFQTGKSKNNDVKASYYALNLGYKIMDNLSFGAGMEYLSGKDMNDTDKTIKSFAPLFGTNHKFNGWMDYFYVGNHGGSVGLMDINANLAYKKNKFSAKVIPHFFSSAADIYKGTTKMDANLGTEVDMVVGYKISKGITAKAGYSMMFATESMEILKGGSKDESNTWGWFMFVFKPTLFSYKKMNN